MPIVHTWCWECWGHHGSLESREIQSQTGARTRRPMAPIGTEHKSDSSESNDGNDARSDIDTRMASHSGKHTTLAPLSLSALEGGMHKESQTRTVLGSNGRKLTPKDPSDHYFCGAGFDDASKSCEYPCPSGSLRECPLGMLCYFNTPCDRKDLPDQPSKSPTIKPGWRPPSQSPWMAGDERLSFFCGKTWDDASSKCGIWCPDTDDTVCPYGKLKLHLRYYCVCQCARESLAQVSIYLTGEVCFRDTLCVADPNPPGLWSPPTPAPWDENAAKLSFFCGVSWSDAGRKCKTWCPDADDSKCKHDMDDAAVAARRFLFLHLTNFQALPERSVSVILLASGRGRRRADLHPLRLPQTSRRDHLHPLSRSPCKSTRESDLLKQQNQFYYHGIFNINWLGIPDRITCSVDLVMLTQRGIALLKLIAERMALATVLPNRTAGLGSLATFVVSSLTNRGVGLIVLRRRKSQRVWG
ncbi:hypothetical protein THAOC_25181 [Thalassiosira oceanica]|uniref:Uncharacterized protein n=1 Tax=Thalassiosira oceanica TaxID=159749 RepID=K0RPT6_THAOC|nr:hypothetical protein THAOC_25181 [Thalassiosira oceanica]|eukprot:EJK55115.1 hypothetical protein THAOC_25181 [Thalassiosira oceanica]